MTDLDTVAQRLDAASRTAAPSARPRRPPTCGGAVAAYAADARSRPASA